MSQDTDWRDHPLGDMPDDVLRDELRSMAEWAADYRSTLRGRAISPSVTPGEITRQLGALPEQPAPMDEILRDLDRVVLPGLVHWGHPSFLGYFGSTSNGPALLGEIAAAALNVSAMTWKTSPAATEMETVVLRWIAEAVGIPETFSGIVYDTASVAVTHALAAARERAAPGSRERGVASALADAGGATLRVYASEQAHSSAEKAMIMLGLGERNVVRVEPDASLRMSAASLAAAMTRDANAGMRALAVIATAGTTSSASVDELPEIADLCRERGVWLHVDAAYGGAIGLLPEQRDLLRGMELADSIVINPHKWLFVPLDFSALYIRHPALLRSVFTLVPEYLSGDAMPAGDENGPARADVDYMDYGIQLGRRFRALKAWMVLRAFGRAGLESRIREHCRLAALFASWIEEDAFFALAAPPQMAVVCFRALAQHADGARSDALNVRIAERVNATGEAYVTHTRLHGRTCLRVGIGNVATTEDDVRGVWDCVQRESRAARDEIGRVNAAAKASHGVRSP